MTQLLQALARYVHLRCRQPAPGGGRFGEAPRALGRPCRRVVRCRLPLTDGGNDDNPSEEVSLTRILIPVAGLLGADVLLAVATPDDGTGVRFAIQREKLQGVLSAACLQWTPSTFDVTRPIERIVFSLKTPTCLHGALNRPPFSYQ
ncbi:hypothetical protein V5799_004374 [Amblyomma americanum]|uniref:Uncharacterized protein n=1 Tax=Amblyomma americanum TaxID=6943 RepID=A0AAQ4D6A4_AMBAM